jgi:uncharacterized membrane protein YhfC
MNLGHLIALLCIPIGIFFMVKNKFWKYDSSDMLSAASLKLFLGGLLFLLIGIYGLVDGIIKLVN